MDLSTFALRTEKITNQNLYLSDKPVLRLKLLREIHGVVNQTEASGLAASEVGLEAEHEDPVRGAVVHLSELLSDVGLGHGGLAGVEDVHHHLPPAEQTVQHVLAGPDGHAAVNHGWDFSSASKNSFVRFDYCC